MFSACSIFPKIYVIDDPLSKEEHLTLGLIYEQNKEYDLAEKEYRYGLPSVEAKLHLANLFFEQKKYKEAEKYYRQILNDNPNHAQAANNLAWLLYSKNKKLKEAKKLAELAFKNAKTENEKSTFQDTLNKINLKINNL